MSTLTEPAVDVNGTKSSMCRRGDHATCRTAKARCGCDCHGNQGQTPPDRLTCPECGRVFVGPQGLAGHRRTAHGIAGATSQLRAGGRAAGPLAYPARTKEPVLLELVREDLPEPEPKPPKLKLIDRIVALVETADLEQGEWWRVALFASPRACAAMCTRLRKTASPYEWGRSGDRLFVRLPVDD